MQRVTTQLYAAAQALRPNDVIYVRNSMKLGDNTFSAVVHSTTVEEDGHLIVVYGPCWRKDSIACGHGVKHFTLDQENPSPYGWQSLVVVGKERPAPRPRGPRPGDPAYDLMH
jgi:hypothetical protein